MPTVDEANGGRSCPTCGAHVTGEFCPQCGAQVGRGTGAHRLSAGDVGDPRSPVVNAAGWSPTGPNTEAHLSALNAEAPTVPSLPVIPRMDGPASALPTMFPTELVPAVGNSGSQAWSQVNEPQPPGPSTGLFPGWTGIHPAVATDGGVGVLASRRVRRRRALYAVLGIAALTAVVLLAALLIAPNWRGTSNLADKNGQPRPTGSSATTVSSSTGPSTAATTSGAQQLPVDSAPVTIGQTAVSAGPAPVSTVTVTATSTAAAAVSPKPSSVKATPKATPKTTPKASPKTSAKPPRTSTPKVAPTAKKPALGVPQRNIACSGGYIVQLASEINAAAFSARVASLQAARQVPAGSLAADSARSCQIFTSQSNTLVLYAGPFASKYDGCAARLAGPADAFIKGGNPGSAKEYVSCLCPASAAGLPQIRTVGQQGVWIGELQRVLGNRLNLDVNDLAGNWGTYTPGTKDAVQKFQEAAKLPASGMVDGRTWQALQSAQC